MADFASSFQAIEEFLNKATGGLMSKLDAMTFKMLVNNLKSSDYAVVVDALNQLEKEKRPISIPPIYYVSRQHPDKRIREKAGNVLKTIDPNGDWEQLTADKPISEAVQSLIKAYGNFRR